MLAVFVAEFDNVLGRKIACQAPEGFIAKDDFEQVAPYIITKPELCGRVVTVIHPALRHGRAGGEPAEDAAAAARYGDTAMSTLGSVGSLAGAGSGASDSAPSATAAVPAVGGKLVAFPMGMQHERYHRNSLMFAVGCVVDVLTDSRPYEAVLRKLGNYLYNMEVESSFLSAPGGRDVLAALLPDILESLNSRGECFLTVGSCDIIALKLFPVLPEAPTVRDSDVPVRVRDLDVLVGSMEDSGWDLCMRHVLPHINGVNYVRAIAECADVEISLVKAVVQQLAYYGCVALIDIFQYGNYYATQPRLQLLLRSPSLRAACLQYIRAQPTSSASAVLPGMLAAQSATALSAVAMTGGGGHGGAPTSRITARGGADGSLPLAPGSPALRPAGGGVGGVLPAPALASAAAAGGLHLIPSALSIADAAAPSHTAPSQPLASPTLPAADTAPALPLLRFDQVFRLYAAFGAGSRTSDICCQGDTAALGIDDRRFVAFGVMHGLLRRIHRYPIPIIMAPTGPGGDVATAPDGGVAATGTAPPGVPKRVHALLNGCHSEEEVCCRLRCSQEGLERLLDATGAYTYVFR